MFLFHFSKKKYNSIARGILLGSIGSIICLPVYLLFIGSFKGLAELKENLMPILTEAGGMAEFGLFPQYPTLLNYLELFFDKPDFYVVFFNSMKIVFITLAGQLLAGVPAAWAFARFRFSGKQVLFTFYIILMMMPFQVTMLSNYLVLNNMGLINTNWSIILPGIFSTFPVFLIYRSFSGIPKGLLEAARIDGAGEWQLFIRIGLPLGSTGILSAFVLGFLEYFSLIEQPLAFLKDKDLWPLSLYLPEIGLEEAGYAFAASVVALIPAVFVFLLGQDYLEKGIVASAMKE